MTLEDSRASTSSSRSSNPPFSVSQKSAPLETLLTEGGSSTETIRGETSIPATHVPDIPTVHSAAQRGDLEALKKLIDEDGHDVNEKDSQGISALHWAAINAQLATCRYLLDEGAEVDAIGGELEATPLQWAARNGHLYVLHLLINRGADPSIKDSQGFNTLHLVTHSSMVMPLLYTIQQPVAVDEKDSDGHTALMWAAYQGDAISVQLLLAAHASPLAIDNNGLTPLHWSVVKGSKSCIRKLLEAGADVETRDGSGKTAGELASELKSSEAWKGALVESGRYADGRPVIKSMSKKTERIIIFAIPLFFLGLIFNTIKILAWYTGPFLAIAEFYGMHHLITRVILDQKSGEPDTLAKSPYFASIIAASLFWVGFEWLTTLVRSTPGYAVANLLFAIFFILCTYCFIRCITLDPGTCVPPISAQQDIKDVIEECIDHGRFNGAGFCINCMAKKPLRSKHCRICQRCVARFDHHCPWIWNCVGSNNHRQFVFFVLNLVLGIITFDYLAFAYFFENAPTWTPTTGHPCVLPTASLCSATGYDSFLFTAVCWATLQLSWTLILLASQVWQVGKQMTTLEVSNLGRFGFMGGRGGQSMAEQAGALSQAGQHSAMGGGGGPHIHGPGIHHGHSHKKKSGGILGGSFTYVLQILGLDRFTKGKAAQGLARANKDANPFDQGLIRNCADFWTAGDSLGVDYTTLYEIPPEGFEQLRREKIKAKKSVSMSKGSYGYAPVATAEEEV